MSTSSSSSSSSTSSPLFPSNHVDIRTISEFVLIHWNLSLGKLLKSSQNLTFKAIKCGEDDKTEDRSSLFVVRVTPCSEDFSSHFSRISLEMKFLNFLDQKRFKGFSKPIKPIKGPQDPTNSHNLYALKAPNNSIICVTVWAEGSPVDFGSYKWLTNGDIIRSQGEWLGRLHVESIDFVRNYPDESRQIRKWNDKYLHSGILQSFILDEKDQKDIEMGIEDTLNSNKIPKASILHGDLNISNFFLSELPLFPCVSSSSSSTSSYSLSVFDWDQLQYGLFEMDLAQSALTCLMLYEGGAIPSGDVVTQSNPKEFCDYLITGYESVRGKGIIDRERFDRMLKLRKSFYSKFCKQAVEEGNIPNDMKIFIDYVNKWIEKVPIQ